MLSLELVTAALLNAVDVSSIETVGEVTAQGVSSTSVFDYITPVLSTGVVGTFLLMILFRVKIMPVYVYDDAKAEWARERQDLQSDVSELKKALSEANSVYAKEVIPTLTRVLDAERELVELRRDQSRGK